MIAINKTCAEKQTTRTLTPSPGAWETLQGTGAGGLIGNAGNAGSPWNAPLERSAAGAQSFILGVLTPILGPGRGP